MQVDHSLENEDKTMPNTKWVFDEEVASVFDTMLSQSIPSYDRMRDLCFQLGKRFVTPNTGIVDLGASLGRAVEPFINQFGSANSYYLYEVSEAMRDRLVNNPTFMIDPVHILNQSIADVGSYGAIRNSLILSILTLQFTPIEHRQTILSNIYNSLETGGAFILVEKVLGHTKLLDDTMVDTYYKMKGENGYTKEQIAAKRKSLEGVLVPVKAKWNQDLLIEAGFSHIDCFYRDLNFAGWIAIK